MKKRLLRTQHRQLTNYCQMIRAVIKIEEKTVLLFKISPNKDIRFFLL